MQQTVTEVVQNGAALLDEVVPDWRSRIKVINLDLGDSQFCVLGQLYGDYDAGLGLLEVQLEDDNHPILNEVDPEAFDNCTWFPAEEYGFYIDSYMRSYSWADLTEAWRAYLNPDAPAQIDFEQHYEGAD